MIPRVLFYVLAAVLFAGLVATPDSTVMEDALRGVAMGAALLLPIALLYAASPGGGEQHRRYQRGHIRAAGMGLLLLAACAGFALRCVHTPVLPPVSGCVPGTTACAGDVKMVCSNGQRWEPQGDEPCAAQQRVCAMTDGGAHCVRVTDGGVPDADQ